MAFLNSAARHPLHYFSVRTTIRATVDVESGTISFPLPDIMLADIATLFYDYNKASAILLPKL